MRRKMIAVFMIVLFFLIMANPIEIVPSSNNLHQYYVYHSLADTGAFNSVTAIYLNYRIFDTLFETLLLLISVIGIIYFSRHEGDY